MMSDSQPMSSCKPAGPGPQSRMGSPPRILVVDDDADIRQLHTLMLIDSGYEVDAAEDGAAAWEILQRQSYNLLITDHIMPKVTGVELLQKVRAARMALPVIMATGTAPEVEFIRDPGLKPAAILLKPYSFEAFLVTVKNVLCAGRSPEDPSVPTMPA